MLAPSPTPAEQPTSLVTEAEALCYLLGDLGLIPAVNLTNDTIYATLSDDVKAGALDVFAVITKRAIEDDDFREEMISAIASSGFYLADSPSINSDLKTADAIALTKALTGAGLLPEIHRPKPGVVGLCYLPVPERKIAPNAHLLMRLATDRFNYEPGFQEAMTAFLSQFEQPRA